MTTRLFQLIDLDRTLFDTSYFAKLLAERVNLQEPGLGDRLEQEMIIGYETGTTFFMLRFLRNHLGDATFEAMVQDIIDEVGSEALLMPGARERLALADELTTVRPSWGILTYGDDIDQFLKVDIVGLQDNPIMLTDSIDKAQIIASWQQDDGTYLLPEVFGGGVVDVVSLEDDKLRAFNSMSESTGAIGVWITNNSEVDNRLVQDTHNNLIVARDLIESAEALKARFV